MHQRLYSSAIVARRHLAAIEIHGEENVDHMAMAMKILKGICDYVEEMPDEKEEIDQRG